MKALDDINVISLAQIYNGPYCTLMLSFLGAEVIKVEPPGGEALRSNDEGAERARPIMVNSSKKSITLDLKTERGKNLFKDLVQDADVLVENYRVGTMDNLGLGYETLSDLNPELIYAHGSGYGETGPYKDFPAFDFTIQAIGGIMNVTGYPDDPPVKTNAQFVDFMGGIHLTAGILAAIHQRERTGQGQFVEANMFESAYPTLTSPIAAHYEAPEVPSRTGNRPSGLGACPYNAYKTSDGHVVIMATNERHWKALVDVIDDDELRKPQYDTREKRAEQMDEVDAIIEEWTRKHERDEVTELLLNVGIPCGPVRELAEVLYDPHLEQRNMVNEIDHPSFGEIRVPGCPIRLHDAENPEINPAPDDGQNNTEVYRGLGLSEDEIKQLEDDGII